VERGWDDIYAFSLGCRAVLPNLYAAAGAHLAYHAATLHEALQLIERTIAQLGRGRPELYWTRTNPEK
jgi:hypothetical protein